jgi:hypothetical protein
MELLLLLLFFLAIGAAALRWGVDSREHHNNWDRV